VGRLGRPTKYSEELAETIAAAIRIGLTNRDACAAVGISEDTFQNWERTKSAFSARVARARAQRVAYAFTQARKAGRDDWRYWFAFLDRVAPEYRARSALEVSGPEGGAIPVTGIELPLPVRMDDPPADAAGDPVLIPLPAKPNGTG
jgi:hypothetical protein